MSKNPLGLGGIEFIEFTADEPSALATLFAQLGMTHTSSAEELRLYQQNDVRFLLNWRAGSFAQKFFQQHGAGICSMGWRVANASEALAVALKNGATQCKDVDHCYDGKPLLALEGIGGSLIYLIEGGEQPNFYDQLGFQAEQQVVSCPNLGFLRIDHLTNNVYQGQLREWSDFYQRIFGFTEIRYFDIRGEQTGLQSFALRSPCGTFCIPINEGTEEKSQINEFLEEYNGCGVQHIALLTTDIIASLQKLEDSPIAMLEMYPEYYDDIFTRVPNVKENHRELQRLNVLADGDDKGYLLQIFTKNLIGPIFFEIIQRENNSSFGEGNFGALFRAIELDQKKRGYLS